MKNVIPRSTVPAARPSVNRRRPLTLSSRCSKPEKTAFSEIVALGSIRRSKRAMAANAFWRLMRKRINSGTKASTNGNSTIGAAAR